MKTTKPIMRAMLLVGVAAFLLSAPAISHAESVAEAQDETGNELSRETIDQPNYNDCYAILPEARCVTLSCESGMSISEASLYSEGTLPEGVHDWQPPIDKADLLVVCCLPLRTSWLKVGMIFLLSSKNDSIFAGGAQTRPVKNKARA